MNIRELLEKFAEEVAESSYDTHGEGSEQREIEDIISEYVNTFYNSINTELDIDKEIEKCAFDMPHGEFTHDSECEEHEEWLKVQLHKFYNFGVAAGMKIYQNS